MQPSKEMCGVVLGEMVIGGAKVPMVCGKDKGHPESEGHSPAAPSVATGVPSDAALKVLGAGMSRPVAPISAPPRLPFSARLRRSKRGA